MVLVIALVCLSLIRANTAACLTSKGAQCTMGIVVILRGVVIGDRATVFLIAFGTRLLDKGQWLAELQCCRASQVTCREPGHTGREIIA